jgi:hypothetical protein
MGVRRHVHSVESQGRANFGGDDAYAEQKEEAARRRPDEHDGVVGHRLRHWQEKGTGKAGGAV